MLNPKDEVLNKHNKATVNDTRAKEKEKNIRIKQDIPILQTYKHAGDKVVLKQRKWNKFTTKVCKNKTINVVL